jgi:hypothetical protein
MGVGIIPRSKTLDDDDVVFGAAWISDLIPDGKTSTPSSLGSKEGAKRK